MSLFVPSPPGGVVALSSDIGFTLCLLDLNMGSRPSAEGDFMVTLEKGKPYECPTLYFLEKVWPVESFRASEQDGSSKGWCRHWRLCWPLLRPGWQRWFGGRLYAGLSTFPPPPPPPQLRAKSLFPCSG